MLTGLCRPPLPRPAAPSASSRSPPTHNRRSSTVKASSSSAAPSVLGEAVCTDVEVDAGELITISDVRGDVLSISASSLRPEGTSVSSSGLDMSVQSRSLSNSGREETPGADQARWLTPSTEADWGGRSLGGPGGAGSAALRRWTPV